MIAALLGTTTMTTLEAVEQRANLGQLFGRSLFSREGLHDEFRGRAGEGAREQIV